MVRKSNPKSNTKVAKKNKKAKQEIKTGYVKKVFRNGDVYKGQMKNDRAHGQGKRIFKFSEGYIGSFYKNGDIMKNAKKNDNKISCSFTGKYQGEWKNGKYHGYGNLHLPRSEVIFENGNHNLKMRYTELSLIHI